MENNNNSRRKGHPLLAFFLGLLLGILLIGGAIAGVVIYVLNLKVDKISANKDSDGNYIYVNGNPDEGGVGTVIDLVKKISAMAKDYNSLTVGEVEVVLPAVGKLTDKLDEAISDFVRLEEGELQAVKFGELSEFVKGLVDRINIATLIGATPDNAILTYLCYGVSGIKFDENGYSAQYKTEDGAVHECFFEMDESNGKIKGAYYIENGEKVYTPNLTFDNASKRVDGVCNDLTVGEIITVREDDKILSSIKNSTINTIADDINSICIQQLFPNDIYARATAGEGQTNPEAEVYLAVEGTPELATVYSDKYIYYEEDEENAGNFKLAGSSNGKLTKDEFDDGAAEGKYFTFGEGKILFDKKYVYYTKSEDGTLTMTNPKKDNQGKLESLDANAQYYTYGGTSPLWKLLLYTEDSDGEIQETVYNFKNINTMISNVSRNTQNSTLRELDAAGILTFNDKSELEKEIVYMDNGTPVRIKIGEIELTRAIGMFVSLVPAAPSAP